MRKSRSLDDEIVAHREQIQKNLLVKKHYPEVEVSYLEDGSKAFVAVISLSKTTSIHFLLDINKKAIVMRPFVEIKRKAKPSIRVFAQQSQIVPSQMCLVDFLNHVGRQCSIAELPLICQKLFGEVVKESDVDKKVMNIINNIKNDQ